MGQFELEGDAKGRRRKERRRTYFFLTTGGSRAATMACMERERNEKGISYNSPKPTRLDGPNASPSLPFLPPSQPKSNQLTSSNTFFNPFCVNAEHSTYFTAPNSLASFSPASC